MKIKVGYDIKGELRWDEYNHVTGDRIGARGELNIVKDHFISSQTWREENIATYAPGKWVQIKRSADAL